MLRIIEPYSQNVKKRMVKSPVVYVRDTGILHNLLDIETMNNLLSHPIYGQSWEGFVIEQILSSLPHTSASFYRNSNGNEIDLILENKGKRVAIECKASTSPSISKGFYVAMNDVGAKEAYIIAPVDKAYPYCKRVTVYQIEEFIKKMRKSFK